MRSALPMRFIPPALAYRPTRFPTGSSRVREDVDAHIAAIERQHVRGAVELAEVAFQQLVHRRRRAGLRHSATSTRSRSRIRSAVFHVLGPGSTTLQSMWCLSV